MKNLTPEQKKTLKVIVELVEDEMFPARRNILDYIEELFEQPIRGEIEKFFQEELRRY